MQPNSMTRLSAAITVSGNAAQKDCWPVLQVGVPDQFAGFLVKDCHVAWPAFWT